MIFNEDKLQEEIIKTYGEFGVHNDIFKAMKKQISDLKQLTLTDVGCSWPSKEEVTFELKQLDKSWKLSEREDEKQAFNLGFRICLRWLRSKAE